MGCVSLVLVGGGLRSGEGEGWGNVFDTELPIGINNWCLVKRLVNISAGKCAV